MGRRPWVDAWVDDTWVDGTYGTCPGHYYTDIPSMEFRNIWDDDDMPYTNQDIYEGTFPQNEGLPWVYDNFEWEHCDDLGYDMANEFDDSDSDDSYSYDSDDDEDLDLGDDSTASSVDVDAAA